MKKIKASCWYCNAVTPCTINHRLQKRIVDGEEYEYMEKYGVCNHCHNEVYVPGLIDDNERRIREKVIWMMIRK